MTHLLRIACRWRLHNRKARRESVNVAALHFSPGMIPTKSISFCRSRSAKGLGMTVHQAFSRQISFRMFYQLSHSFIRTVHTRLTIGASDANRRTGRCHFAVSPPPVTRWGMKARLWRAQNPIGRAAATACAVIGTARREHCTVACGIIHGSLARSSLCASTSFPVSVVKIQRRPSRRAALTKSALRKL
jgi:hypothetical protein